MRKYSLQSGVSLIEAILGIAIITVMVIAIGFSIDTYMNARAELLTNTKAMYLAEEGYEIARALRNEDWNLIDSLVANDVYYFAVATSTLAITATPEVIDTNFVRSFVVRELYRDTNDDITASTTSGAVVDPDAREIEVYVSGPTGTTSLQAILTNMFAI